MKFNLVFKCSLQIPHTLIFYLDPTYVLDLNSLLEEGYTNDQVLNAIEKTDSLELEALKTVIKQGKLRKFSLHRLSKTRLTIKL